MRTISAALEKVLELPSRSEHIRVQVKDGGGTWRDLTTYPEFNAVVSASIKNDPDAPGPTADITLRRSSGGLTLSTLMETSALNLGFNPAGTYSPLISIGREVKVEVAVTPMGQAPVSGDWMLLFHGRIDNPDDGGEDQITFGARDLSGRLMDQWIRQDRMYAFGEVSGAAVSMRVWQEGMTVAVGEYACPSDSKIKNAKFFYKATSITTGVTGSSEPAWSGSGTFSDNGVTWTYQGVPTDGGQPVEEVMQNMLDDALGAGVCTLYVPTSPSFVLLPLLQSREPLMPLLRKTALCFGGDVRFEYRSATQQFELTLIVIDRAPSSTVRTFGPSQWKAIPRCAQDISTIRTTVDLWFRDTGDLDSAGNAKRKLVRKTNSSAAADIGYDIWMELDEGDTGPIDTSTEADAMAQAALDDVSTPDVDVSIELALGFPWVELRDYVKLAADGDHFDSDQSVAVYSYEHAYESGHLKTTLNCRGKPSAGRRRWHNASTHPFRDTIERAFSRHTAMTNMLGGLEISATPIIGGARLELAGPPKKFVLPERYEVHIGDSSGFAPSVSTLRSMSDARAFEVSHLQPGATKYAKVIPIGNDRGSPVRGEPTPALEFTSGRAQAAHLQPGLDTSLMPLNGAFETRWDAGGLPDGWTGGGAAVREDTGGLSGTRYIRLTGADSPPGLSSELCPVREGSWYRLSAWVKGYSGSANFALKTTWLERTQSQGDLTPSTMATFAANAYGSWTRVSAIAQAPTGARFARITILPANSSSASAIDIDEVRLESCAEDWVAPGSLLNSWVAYDATNFPLGYYMDLDGNVHLRGLAKDGTPGSSSVIFTLPTGYRPAKARAHCVISNGSAAYCRVDTNGDVVAVNGSGSWFSLDGVSFRTA